MEAIKESVWVHRLGAPSTRMGKMWCSGAALTTVTEVRGAGILHPQSGSRDKVWYSACFFPFSHFIRSGNPAQRMHCRSSE